MAGQPGARNGALSGDAGRDRQTDLGLPCGRNPQVEFDARGDRPTLIRGPFLRTPGSVEETIEQRPHVHLNDIQFAERCADLD
jgi:hypothetical protein